MIDKMFGNDKTFDLMKKMYLEVQTEFKTLNKNIKDIEIKINVLKN